MHITINNIILFLMLGCIGQIIVAGETNVNLSSSPHIAPELVDYLCREAAKIGVKCSTMDELRNFRYSTNEAGGLEQGNILRQKIDFVEETRKIPTKENLMAEIMAPEDRDAPEFTANTGNPWNRTNFSRRLRAFNLLYGVKEWTSQDITRIRESYSTARYWESQVAAIALLCRYDKEYGKKLADSYLLNNRNSLAGRVALIQNLLSIDMPQKYSLWENILAEGLRSDDGSVRRTTSNILLHDRSGEIDKESIIKNARQKSEDNIKQIEKIAKKLKENTSGK